MLEDNIFKHRIILSKMLNKLSENKYL